VGVQPPAPTTLAKSRTKIQLPTSLCGGTSSIETKQTQKNTDSFLGKVSKQYLDLWRKMNDSARGLTSNDDSGGGGKVKKPHRKV